MLTLGGIRVDPVSGRAWRGPREIELAETERRILAEVVRCAPQLVRREDLARALWPDGVPGSRALDMAWSRLRRRLAPDGSEHLVTVRGAGFAVRPGGTPTASGGLPTPDTAFVGLLPDLERAREWIARGVGRWLTITGVGGMGKTRLAMEIARRCMTWGPAPVWVDLAPVSDGDPVLLAVGRRLGVDMGRTGEPVDSALERALGSHAALVFLDNLEHVPRAAARLGVLMARCPSMRVVATSRRRLGVPGEETHHLSGLSLADEAPELYTSLVRRYFVAPPTDALEPTLVDAVCRASMGHPLTIELAVATLRRGPPQLLRAALDSPARLQGERSGRNPRHASFEGTFAYSWSLLGEPARHALAALSLFAGPFTVEEARELLGVGPAAVGELVDQSLVERDGESLSVHPLIREVARRALTDLDPEGAVQEAFRDRLSSWLGAQVEGLRRDVPGLPGAIERRLNDIAAAWHEAVRRRDHGQLAAAWPGLRAWIELREAFRLGVSLLDGVPERVDDPGLRVTMRSTLAGCQMHVGMAEAAGEVLRQVLDDPSCTGALRVQALTSSALHQAWSGRFDLADATLDEAHREASRAGDPETLARLHLAHGTRFRVAGRSDLGGEHGERALAAAREAGVGALVRRSLVLRASWLFANSRFAEAVQHAREVERLAQAASDPYGVDAALNIRGLGQRQLGELEGSLASFTRLLGERSRAPTTNLAYLMNQRATALLDLGRLDEAAEQADAGLRLARAHGLVKDVSFLLLTCGHLALARGDTSAALARGAERRAFEHEFAANPASETLTCVLRLTAAWLGGDLAVATTELERARRVFPGDPPYIRHLLELGAALVHARRGNRGAAHAAVGAALDIAERSGPVAVRRALYPALLALACIGEAELAARARPVLRDGPLLERWIHLPAIDALTHGVEAPDPLRDPLDVLEAVRAMGDPVSSCTSRTP